MANRDRTLLEPDLSGIEAVGYYTGQQPPIPQPTPTYVALPDTLVKAIQEVNAGVDAMRESAQRAAEAVRGLQRNFEVVYPPSILYPEDNRCKLIPLELACDPADPESYSVVITEAP